MFAETRASEARDLQAAAMTQRSSSFIAGAWRMREERYIARPKKRLR